MMFKLLGGTVALTLAFTAAPVLAQDAHDRPAIQLAANGLELRDMESGHIDTVGFGTDMDTVVEAISGAINAPNSSNLDSDCGAGPLQIVDFDGDLHLYFKAGEFVGWEADEGSGYSSAREVRVGMTSDELMAATDEMEGSESTLGYEFQADGFSGILTEGGPNGKITHIWAGTNCPAR